MISSLGRFDAEQMAELKFSENHNIAAYLLDPPAAHQEFRAMIHGLKRCCLAYAFTSNPTIFHYLVKQFWNKASVSKWEDEEDTVESVIQGKKIVVSEQTIREVLQINDQPGFHAEISMEQTQEIIKRMGYEGVFPPTLKKLLPPYWRFLAHSFVICIPGRKFGADEISY